MHQLAVTASPTIVKPDTLLRWIRAEKKDRKKTPAERGRRCTPEKIRRLTLKQHAASLWQFNFFSNRIFTLNGVHETFVLAFLNMKTRQVVLSPATFYPNEAWVVLQAESFVEQARCQGLPVTIAQRDRDTKYAQAFDAKLKILRVKIKLGAFLAPNTNADVERSHLVSRV